MSKNEWLLIEDEKFEEACILADVKFKENGSDAVLRNKVFALLHLKRFEQAREVCDNLIARTHGRVSDDFIAQGVAFWLAGKQTEAIIAWHAGRNALYKDAAGGVVNELLLYYASFRVKDDQLQKSSLDNVTQLCHRPKGSSNWPGSLGRLILGEISEEEVINSIDGPLKERHLCQAYFWIGVHVMTKAEVSYSEMMRQAISRNPISYLEYEYYLAKAELSRSMV